MPDSVHDINKSENVVSKKVDKADYCVLSIISILSIVFFGRAMQSCLRVVVPVLRDVV